MPLIGTIGSNTSGASTTGVSVFTFTTNTTLSAGKTIVGSFIAEAANGIPTLAVTDTHSNTYSIDKQVTNTTNVSVSIFSCRITTQINSGDTITITSSGTNPTRNRWAVTAQAFDDILNSRLDQTATATGSGTAMNGGTTPTTTVTNELVYAGFGTTLGNSPTTSAGAGFTGSAQVNTTAASANRGGFSEWKYISATGAQTPLATLSASGTWAGATATYKSSASNVSPTANAGPDQNVTVSSTVTLNGSGSSDPDGTIASYAWTQISGTSVTLSSSSVVSPTFTAPASPATLVFGLTVTDNLGATSSQDTVTINVASKIGYVAEAAGSVSTTSATNFTLNYLKAVPAGHTVLMGVAVDGPVGSDNAPSLTVTDTKGNTYTMDAVGYRTSTVGTAVISGYITSAVTTSDTITITSTNARGRWAVSAAEFDNIHQSGLDVTAHNDNPAASNPATVGPTATTQNQVEVVFASFGFGDNAANVLTPGTNYAQAGTQRQTGTTSGHRGISSEYRIYTAAAAQTATATLTPAVGYSAAIATYAADLIADIAPTANAGSNQTVAAFDTVTLDGTGSTDTDGTVAGWSWAQTVGPTVTLSSNTASQPTFTAPGVNGGTSVTFSLVVTDNLGTSSTNGATVTITVNSAEQFIAHSSAWTSMQEFAAHASTWS